MTENDEIDEIDEMMRAFFEDLGLDDASDSEMEDLIAIHGQALGGCALEFRRELAKRSVSTEVPQISAVLEQIRASFFQSPVSGKALILELTERISAESLRNLLLTAHLAIRAASARVAEKQISLLDALDDVVITIGHKATNECEPGPVQSEEAWCRHLFVAAQITAEMTTGKAFFRDYGTD